MITEDYVSFETAKLLKKKEFRCDTLHYYYDKDGDLLFSAWSIGSGKNECSAPTLQMVMKWFREVHNILVVIDYNYECTSKSYCYKIYHLGKNGKPKKVFPVYGVSYDDEGNECRDIIYYRDFELSYSDYTTYEEAVEAAIYYCLEYLI